MTGRALVLAMVLGLLAGTVACTARPGDSAASGTKERSEISRDRAIEIARQQVKFEPRQVEAEKADENGRAVWKVIFRGQPPGPGHAMGDYMEVRVDRHTGEIVGLAMS